jgi:hypothetical protein
MLLQSQKQSSDQHMLWGPHECIGVLLVPLSYDVLSTFTRLMLANCSCRSCDSMQRLRSLITSSQSMTAGSSKRVCSCLFQQDAAYQLWTCLLALEELRWVVVVRDDIMHGKQAP